MRRLIEDILPMDVISRDAAIEMSYKRTLGLSCEGMQERFLEQLEKAHLFPGERINEAGRDLLAAALDLLLDPEHEGPPAATDP